MGEIIDIQYLLNCIPQILKYLPITITLAVASMFFGLILGLITALTKIYKVPILNQTSILYVSFVRGTPLLVQLFLIYYGIPKIFDVLKSQYGLFGSFNINVIPPEFFAVAAFAINLGAYLSETIRSAIESIDLGQFEAANSIGMTRTQMMLLIVLPQATLVALPNLGNTLISMVKDTSLAFMIMVMEIMGQAKIIGARGLRIFEVYIAASLIYWGTCIILEKLISMLEKRLRVYERNVAE